MDGPLAQWKMLVLVNGKNSKQIDNSIISLKKQLLGVILCFFMIIE